MQKAAFLLVILLLIDKDFLFLLPAWGHCIIVLCFESFYDSITLFYSYFG